MKPKFSPFLIKAYQKQSSLGHVQNGWRGVSEHGPAKTASPIGKTMIPRGLLLLHFFLHHVV